MTDLVRRPPMTDLSNTYFPIKDGRHAFAPTLETVRKHQFPTTPLWKQGIISRDKEPDSGSKEFLAVNDFTEFIAKEVMESKEDRHLYELVTERTCVRPYFDLEWDAGNDFEAEIAMLDTAVEVICKALSDAGFVGRGISIYTASGPCASMLSGRKASYHILFDTVQVFRNAKHHKVFVDQYLIPMADELFYMTRQREKKCIIDAVPYTSAQSFRLPYQSKWKAAGIRRLVPLQTPLLQFVDAGVYTIGVYEDIEAPMEFAQVGRVIRVPVRNRESLDFPKVEPLCALLSDEFLRGYKEAQSLIYCLWGIEASERMCTLIHAVCRRVVNYEYAWVQGLIRGCKYSAFSIGSLVLWATACSDKDRVKRILKQYRVRYHTELFDGMMRPARTRVLHQRYLGDIAFDDCDTLILQSALGTGKTVSITNLIRAGGYARILIVSPRKSYTHSQIGVFQSDRTLPDMRSYLDVMGSLGAVDYLIVQAESLHRLSTNTVPYDLVIMDESESILCQMHSVTTHGKNMIANHEMLQRVVSSARHVIFADAFVSDRTFHMSHELRGQRPLQQGGELRDQRPLQGDELRDQRVLLIQNTFQPYQRQAIHLASVEKDVRVANIGGFCERIMAALEAGRRIVVIWTSKRRGDWFVEHFLKGSEYTYIFYNSASTKEEQEGLKNVNETWGGIQCLMMTTSITVGISYNPVGVKAVREENSVIRLRDETEANIGGGVQAATGGVAAKPLGGRAASESPLTAAYGGCLHYDEAFLYASSASALPRDIAQSLLRVRVLKANRLTYVLDTRVGANHVLGFTSVWNQLSAKEQQQEKDHPLVAWKTCPPWVRFNHCYNLNEERISRAEYRDVLQRYLVDSGYVLQEETHMPAAAIRAMPMETGDAVKWDNIEDVSWDGAEDILATMKRGEATVEEVLQYKKWSFRGQLACSEEDAKGWWERFYESGREAAFWNVVREKRLTITDVASKEAEARYGIMTTAQIAQRKTLMRFLEILGMQHSQEEVLLDAERLAALGEPLQAAEREIREGMGLRKSERKGEWKVGNTMDLIETVLDTWGAVKAESQFTYRKVNKKSARFYSLNIRGNIIMWNNIINSHVNYDENLLKL